MVGRHAPVGRSLRQRKTPGCRYSSSTAPSPAIERRPARRIFPCLGAGALMGAGLRSAAVGRRRCGGGGLRRPLRGGAAGNRRCCGGCLRHSLRGGVPAGAGRPGTAAGNGRCAVGRLHRLLRNGVLAGGGCARFSGRGRSASRRLFPSLENGRTAGGGIPLPPSDTAPPGAAPGL